jgi:hypothetical protein
MSRRCLCGCRNYKTKSEHLKPRRYFDTELRSTASRDVASGANQTDGAVRLELLVVQTRRIVPSALNH